MGEIYMQAIEYFAEAYEARDFLADAACRQLNFYSGIDKYTGERLGDLFTDGILKKNDLATLFFEGNTTITSNIRKLISLGVSYNADGKHYLEKVGESAKKMDADPTVFNGENYGELADIIATSIPVFRNMFEELSAYEKELNYEDDVVTDIEAEYVEHKSIADRMRAVEYLGGKTLYDFCMEYDAGTSDHTSIYPLVDALNDGQTAMTKLLHYYDVVRYSMTDYPEELIDNEITALEEKYAESAVNVYLGVDRAVYTESFAITSNAHRADAYTGSTSLADALFGKGALTSTALQITSGAVGVGLAVWAIVRTAKGHENLVSALEISTKNSEKIREMAIKHAEAYISGNADDLNALREFCIAVEHSVADDLSEATWKTLSGGGKIEALMKHSKTLTITKGEQLWAINERYYKAFTSEWEKAEESFRLAAIRNSKIFTGVLYVLSVAALTYSAINLYNKIYDHYHPTYDEIPTSMVDLVRTDDGDRYIKYNVVYEAQLRDGKTHAADLNAFQGERWNALYYTKSSEAGKPLVADFEVSNNNNRASDGYLAVHRFGEVICYDLNKYNFSSSSLSVFLKIGQSDAEKSDVTSVPDIIGAIFGSDAWLLTGCVGIILGVGCTIGTQRFLGKRNTDKKESEE
jgi:hypothetical protein